MAKLTKRDVKRESLVVRTVYDFFTNSSDFNGIPLEALASTVKIGKGKLVQLLLKLVRDGLCSVQALDNPHIIRVRHFSIEEQEHFLHDAKESTPLKLDWLPNISFGDTVCIYPSKAYLEANRELSMYDRSPYSRQLALGEPHLAFRFFEINVLERYKNDPRFEFRFEDYDGRIVYKEDHIPDLKEKERFLLETFGLGFDSSGDRVLLVYLRELSKLPADQQVYWQTFEIKDLECKALHEYVANTVYGSWEFTKSVYSAFLDEQKALNELSLHIFGVALFRNTYEGEKRPTDFTFSFFPTKKNFLAFVSLMDKMICENLNLDFFRSQNVEIYQLTQVSEGVVERTLKNKLRLLEEWLMGVWKVAPGGEDEFKTLFGPFNDIRKVRNRLAHELSGDSYDKSLFAKQNEVIEDAYSAMKDLRFMFQKHRKARSFDISTYIDDFDVKSF